MISQIIAYRCGDIKIESCVKNGQENRSQIKFWSLTVCVHKINFTNMKEHAHTIYGSTGGALDYSI